MTEARATNGLKVEPTERLVSDVFLVVIRNASGKSLRSNFVV